MVGLRRRMRHPGIVGGIAIVFSMTAPLTTAPREQNLKTGLLLYAMPGLPDPNFGRTVVLLVEHGPQGTLGVVVNRPLEATVGEALDLKPSARNNDVPLYWGGPVQPKAVLALVRSPRLSAAARTIVRDVQLTPDLDDIKVALDQRNARLTLRVFSGYAGWGPGQLAEEVRHGSWVLEPADAGTVFSPEPSRLWEKVREILGRIQADADPARTAESDAQ
jgi:putative transcriptional regulator